MSHLLKKEEKVLEVLAALPLVESSSVWRMPLNALRIRSVAEEMVIVGSLEEPLSALGAPSSSISPWGSADSKASSRDDEILERKLDIVLLRGLESGSLVEVVLALVELTFESRLPLP